MTTPTDPNPAREPKWFIRRAYLWLHAKRHPDHVLVGWNGPLIRCGTCLGLARPENGLPRVYLPKRHPARKVTR